MTIMTSPLDARILENNQSWYWELIDGRVKTRRPR